MTSPLTSSYDIAIIGSGPGGYVAAIHAANLGAKVALIEYSTLGGTCLNRGCIPTKALIANAKIWKKIQHAHDFGIEVQGAQLNYKKMKTRKDEIVNQIRSNLKGLISSNQIDIINGYARLHSEQTIRIYKSKLSDENREITAEKIILATGSEPLDIPAFACDGKAIHNSTSILDITKIPDHLLIIGGGFIGCEFASLFSQLGSKVTLVEALDRILYLECEESSHFLENEMRKNGINIMTKSQVKSIQYDKNEKLCCCFKESIDDIQADAVLVSVGRKLNTNDLGLERVGIALNEKGAIIVDDRMQTNINNIYAIGDITGKWLLAHTASHQAITAANNASGRFSQMHYNAVPSVVFTDPEVASVGLTLKAAQKASIKAKKCAFPFNALGKSQASSEVNGFAQVIIEEATGKILGAQVVGHEAGALIAEMTLAIENELTIECVSQTIHAHPTISEIWLESALLAQDEPIHIPSKKCRSK